MSVNPKMKRPEILEHALRIVQKYKADGYEMTLRQLYYQFVATGLIPNGQDQYKRIKGALSAARLVGDFPLDSITDRTRTVHEGNFTENETDMDNALGNAAIAIRNTPYWYLTQDRWYGQNTHVSVWVEKEALSGVLEKPCEELGISWFAAKGYPSHSSIYAWIKTIEQAYDEGTIEDVVIIYLGDHDPDGLAIPNTTMRVIGNFMEQMDLDHIPVRLKRVALTIEQIREYNPPPFPAKNTSSRFKGYVESTGLLDAWELDALPPNVLDALIRREVDVYWDEEVYQEGQAQLKLLREEMSIKMRDPGDDENGESWIDRVWAEKV